MDKMYRYFVSILICSRALFCPMSLSLLNNSISLIALFNHDIIDTDQFEVYGEDTE